MNITYFCLMEKYGFFILGQNNTKQKRSMKHVKFINM